MGFWLGWNFSESNFGPSTLETMSYFQGWGLTRPNLCFEKDGTSSIASIEIILMLTLAPWNDFMLVHRFTDYYTNSRASVLWDRCYLLGCQHPNMLMLTSGPKFYLGVTHWVTVGQTQIDNISRRPRLTTQCHLHFVDRQHSSSFNVVKNRASQKRKNSERFVFRNLDYSHLTKSAEKFRSSKSFKTCFEGKIAYDRVGEKIVLSHTGEHSHSL